MLPESDPLQPIAQRLVERLRIAHTLALPQNFLPGVDPSGRPAAAAATRSCSRCAPTSTGSSPALRHALRTAVVATPALAFTMLWFNPYDHWLTITIVATMQPYFALTYARALERIIGTALGGLVAALVGLLFTTPLAMAAAMFPLAVVALSVRAVSVSLLMATLTPLIVLLVETGQRGTSEWLIAAVRFALTTLGGMLAVAANFLLWPSLDPIAWARRRVARSARTAAYADAALGFRSGEVPPPGRWTSTRRAAGVATNSLEASISRALTEPGAAGRDRLEAALVIDAALRRFAGRLAAMQLDPGLAAALSPEALARLARLDRRRDAGAGGGGRRH